LLLLLWLCLLLLLPLCLLLLLLLRGTSGMAHSAPWCHQKASSVVLQGLQEPAVQNIHSTCWNKLPDILNHGIERLLVPAEGQQSGAAGPAGACILLWN
jgi:hypothetical protein